MPNDRAALTVIGRCALRGPDGDRVIAGRRARIACVALAFAQGAVVPREGLAFALWGDELPASWAPSLREVLADVRADVAAVGLDGAVVREGGGYALRLPSDIELAAAGLADAEAALAARQADTAHARAAEARRLADRPLLPGEQGQWMEDRREELLRLVTRALEIEASAALRAGHPELAVPAATRLTALEPLRDSAALLAMHAHDAYGNRAAALHAYYTHRDALDDALGITPSAAVETAFLGLLRRDQPAAETLPGPLAAATAEALIGAEPLESLIGVFKGGAEAAASAVLLTGEAGSGKTRTAAELAAHCARDGAAVLYGRCDELPLAPFQPLAEALDTWLVTAPAGSVGEAEADLAPLIPRLARSSAPPNRARLFAAVVEALARIAATQRVLLVIDDVHWCDADTTLLLRHIARAGARLRGALLVLTTRTAAAATVGAVQRELHVERFALRPLDSGQLEELAAALGAAPAEVAEVAHYAGSAGGGNPLLATELIRTRLATGNGAVPQAITALVAYRVAELSTAARDVLELTAVARGIDASLLEQASGARFVTAVGEALASGLVVHEGHAARYRPAHPVLGAAIVDGLGEAAVAQRHSALASVLAAGARRDSATLAALAHHLAAAGSEQHASEAAHAAAVAAIDELAYGQAVRWERMALDHADPTQPRWRLEVLLGLGKAHSLCGELADAEAAFDDALALARRQADPLVFGYAVLAYGRQSSLNIDLAPRSRDLLDEALAALPDDALELRNALDEHRIRLLTLDGQPGAVEGAAELERRAPPLKAALHARLFTLGGPGDADERLAVAGRLTAAAEGDVELAMTALQHRAFALFERGDALAAFAAHDEYVRVAADVGRPEASWTAAHMEALRAIVGGRFGAVDALLEAVQATGVPAGGEFVAGASRRFAGQSYMWLQGRCGESADVDLQTAAAMPHITALLHSEVFFDNEVGRAEAARERLGAEVERFAAQAAAPTVFWSVAAFHLSSTAVELTALEEAAALFEALAPHADRHCVYTGLMFYGAFELHLGSLAALLGHWGDARARLTRALERHEAMRSPPWAALTRGRLAAVLERLGDPAAAALSERAQREARTFRLRPLPPALMYREVV